MLSPDNNDNPNLSKILEKLEQLEERVYQVEKKLDIDKTSEKSSLPLEEITKEIHSDIDAVTPEPKVQNNDDVSSMESRIGEVGLAWLGSIVLLFGIAFIAQFLHNKGYAVFSSIMGFASVVAIYGTSYFIRKSYSSLSDKLYIISHLLLYFVIMRLHFYASGPLIESKGIVLGLLMIVFGMQMFIFVKKKSEFLCGIAISLLLVTAFISHSTHFMFSAIALAAASSVYFFFKYSWWQLMMLTQFLVYVSTLFWFFIDPHLHNSVETDLSNQYTIIYLFLIVSFYSLVTLIKEKDTYPESLVFFSVILNGILFSFLLSVYVFNFYLDNYVGIFSSIAGFAILFSIVLKQYSEWRFSAALYALYGFVALSIAIFGVYGLPNSYFLLSIQSLLVVSMAIWFRSKIIVVMNLLLFVFVLFGYFVTTESVNSINISFAIVPLVTARIINWAT